MAENDSPWEYKSDGQPAADQPLDQGDKPAHKHHHLSDSISWEAPEFIEIKHSSGWYGGLILATTALAAIVYFVTAADGSKDYFATATVVILGIIVGVFATHKPGQAQYEITSRGLGVNGKTYSYSAYKSFTIFREGQLTSLNLFPLKRFSPPVSAYFPPADEPKIIQAIGNYLPYEDRQLDGVDRLSRRLHL